MWDLSLLGPRFTGNVIIETTKLCFYLVLNILLCIIGESYLY